MSVFARPFLAASILCLCTASFAHHIQPSYRDTSDHLGKASKPVDPGFSFGYQHELQVKHTGHIIPKGSANELPTLPEAEVPTLPEPETEVPIYPETEEPTVEPTTQPTAGPTQPETVPPTPEPTVPPTAPPTPEPTAPPTPEPTVPPTPEPTVPPTPKPSVPPTPEPTVPPTPEPTVPLTPEPTAPPTPVPTVPPTPEATVPPTLEPTVSPTPEPTAPPPTVPTHPETDLPSFPPIEVSTESPTEISTEPPTEIPTEAPTEIPIPTTPETPSNETTEVPVNVTTDFPTNTTEVPSNTTMPPEEIVCTCGKVNRAGRIVGGVTTEMHEYPWQVELVSAGSNRVRCGGSIISDQWIITAAHCVDDSGAINREVIAGEHNWGSESETNATQRRSVAQVVLHPGHDPKILNNDVALLKLSEPLVFGKDNKVAPVCFPTPGEDYAHLKAIITGWGTTSRGGSVSTYLREVRLPTLTNDECAELYTEEEITLNMICAGFMEGGKDSCQGDSGGPMVTTDGLGNMIQIGVVSWGYGCGRPNYPGVYARVTRYLEWIQEYMQGSNTCPPYYPAEF